MAKRKAISKTTRFEVFKRDKFTCQYCGKSAPDVVLHVDHVQPVSKDGDNDMMNLITSCVDCNLGKKDRELSDDSALKKQKQMLDELQERREQIEMMLEWQRSLSTLNDEMVEKASDYWSELIESYHLTDLGESDLRKSIKRFGFQKVIEAMIASVEQYAKRGDDGKYTSDSVQKAFEYIVRICAARQRNEQKPYMQDLYYIRGIVRNRTRCNDWQALDLLEDAYNAGNDVDYLKHVAKTARNWSDWCDQMEQLCQRAE